MQSMLHNGVYWAGTIAPHNRSNVPKEVMKGSQRADKLPRSHCIWMYAGDGMTLHYTAAETINIPIGKFKVP
ncbi:MAG: hypothetical protein GY820_08380 [Gammaproteobacteria bacterium]|nr:hypothetical protein [Gammaproteobacteria bacterium]